MSFCQNCGQPLAANSNVCPQCSPRVAQASTAQASAAPVGAAVAALPQTSSGLQPNAAAALSYLAGFITGILFLVLEPYKNDRFVRFHALQSIFFNVAWVVLWVVWLILGFVLGAITHGLFIFIQIPVDLLIVVCGFCIWAYLTYAASQGKTFRLPIIGALAAKQAGI
jgi:uncharacterized membrane protein